MCLPFEVFQFFFLNDKTPLPVIWLTDFSFRETLIIWVELVTTLRHFANVATVWSSTEIDDSRLTMTCFSTMLSKVAVDSKLNVSSELKLLYFGNGWENYQYKGYDIISILTPYCVDKLNYLSFVCFMISRWIPLIRRDLLNHQNSLSHWRSFLSVPLFNCFYLCASFHFVCTFVQMFLSVRVFSSCMHLCSILFFCACVFLLFVPLFNCFYLCLCFSSCLCLCSICFSVGVSSYCMCLCSFVLICVYVFIVLYVPLFFCIDLCVCVYRLVCSITLISVHVCALV